MATKIEAAKQFTYATAWRFANGEYPVREISMAKLYASRMCREVADECVQILGGYGYMKEYEIERAYRDHAPQPDRRRHRRDHARGHRPQLRSMSAAEPIPCVTCRSSPVTRRSADPRAAVRGICEGFGGPDYHRRMRRRRASRRRELWDALAEKGYLGVNLPEAYGGGGLGMYALQRSARRSRRPAARCC